MIRSDRTGRPPTRVRSASGWVLAAILPDILHRSLGETNPKNGLAGRLLFASPPTRIRRWTQARVHRSVRYRYAETIKNLFKLEPGFGDFDKPRPPIVKMTPEAHDAWVEYFNRQNEEGTELSGGLDAASMASRVSGDSIAQTAIT